jgi:hypothetical protein
MSKVRADSTAVLASSKYPVVECPDSEYATTGKVEKEFG